VIVVIGPVHLLGEGTDATPGGPSGDIARAAVLDGAAVELIAKVGDDPPGDALLVALAQAGIGHVAVLRDAVHPTAIRRTTDLASIEDAIDGVSETVAATTDWTVPPESAPVLDADDVGLALRYLSAYRVIVAVRPAAAVLVQALAAADWATAAIIVIDPVVAVDGDVPAGTVVLSLNDQPDPGSAPSEVAARIGRYAAALDRGDAPSTAWDVLTQVADRPLQPE
jgi:hypothetical protein